MENIINKLKNKFECSDESFENLKKIGDIGEYIAIQYLENLGEKIINKNNTKEFDIKTNLYLYEIKFDIKAITTQNLFIETYTTYKKPIIKSVPSGIYTTKAHFYIFVIPNLIENLYTIIKVPTNELKTLIKNKKYRCLAHNNKYYNTISNGFIIPIEEIKKYSVIDVIFVSTD